MNYKMLCFLANRHFVSMIATKSLVMLVVLLIAPLISTTAKNINIPVDTVMKFSSLMTNVDHLDSEGVCQQNYEFVILKDNIFYSSHGPHIKYSYDKDRNEMIIYGDRIKIISRDGEKIMMQFLGSIFKLEVVNSSKKFSIQEYEDLNNKLSKSYILHGEDLWVLNNSNEIDYFNANNNTPLIKLSVDIYNKGGYSDCFYSKWIDFMYFYGVIVFVPQNHSFPVSVIRNLHNNKIELLGVNEYSNIQTLNIHADENTEVVKALNVIVKYNNEYLGGLVGKWEAVISKTQFDGEMFYSEKYASNVIDSFYNNGELTIFDKDTLVHKAGLVNFIITPLFTLYKNVDLQYESIDLNDIVLNNVRYVAEDPYLLDNEVNFTYNKYSSDINLTLYDPFESVRGKVISLSENVILIRGGDSTYYFFKRS